MKAEKQMNFIPQTAVFAGLGGVVCTLSPCLLQVSWEIHMDGSRSMQEEATISEATSVVQSQ